MHFEGDLLEEYQKRVENLRLRGVSVTLRGVSAYEENVDAQGKIFGTKNKALAVAQNLFDARAPNTEAKHELWRSFFEWIASRRVVIVK